MSINSNEPSKKPKPVNGVDYFTVEPIKIIDGSDFVMIGKNGLLFDQDKWQKDKLCELGLNAEGEPLRAWEKPMPEAQINLM